MSSVPPLLGLMIYPTLVHFIYAIIWVVPSLWFPRHPPLSRVKFFGRLAYSKTCVFYLLLPWYLGTLSPTLFQEPYWWRICALIGQQRPLLQLLGIASIVSGVLLEVASFAAIGQVAILYGCKFGAQVEWVDNAWPYTWTSHPQHIGVILIQSAWVALGWTEATGMVAFIAWWAFLYGLQTLVECYLAQDEHTALRGARSSFRCRVD